MSSQENILAKIEELALESVDIDEKDINEITEFLVKLESIQKDIKVTEEISRIFELIKKELERLILKEIEPISDIESVFNKIQDGIELLKQFMYNENESEIKSFIENNTTPEIEPDNQNETGKNTIEEVPQVDEIDSSKENLDTEDDFEAEDDIFEDFLMEANDYIDVLETGIIQLEQFPTDKEIINNIFRPFHTIKGVSGFMGLKKLNRISHETENLLDLARNGELAVTKDVIESVLMALDLMKMILSNLSVDNRSELVDQDILEAFIKNLNQVQKSGKKVEIIEVDRDAIQAEIEQKTTSSKPGTDSQIRIRTEKLDYLIDMVGELVISANLIRQDKNITTINNQEFSTKMAQLTRVVSDLQRAAMSLRMVPIGTTFQKMKRIVRDLTKKSNKQIDLILQGQETEIDRHLVDSLYDPLVHMIRNSCDHGIESPKNRKDCGKNSCGTITLNAYHKGNNVNIDIIDDGKGLNKEKILEKALNRNLINKNSNLPDEEIWDLIFNPGFSTADKITNVSGRGVGMDVVKQAIKKLGGDIKTTSQKNKGCKFQLQIPLTLAIIEGLLVTIMEELFIIPVNNVTRFIQPKNEMINSVVGELDTIKLEDKLIPIVDLEKKFMLTGEGKDLLNSILVIVKNSYQTFALRVDEIITIQDIVVKNMGKKFKDLKGVSGATILGDGSVGLILDVNQII